MAATNNKKFKNGHGLTSPLKRKRYLGSVSITDPLALNPQMCLISVTCFVVQFWLFSGRKLPIFTSSTNQLIVETACNRRSYYYSCSRSFNFNYLAVSPPPKGMSLFKLPGSQPSSLGLVFSTCTLCQGCQ